jgi:predicted DNA-binding transcriptional regulator YafY
MGKRIAPTGGRDEQIRRTARILEIVQQIAVASHQWSRQRLAEYHEISERMIGKDIELIRYRLGLQLEHDGQAYYFERLPQLPTTAYSFEEALSLLIAARTAQTLPGVNSANLAAAIARLETIFPDELQMVLHEATETLPKRAIKAHRQKMLTLLHRAWVERRQIQIVYATGSRQGKVNKRVIEPYHLMPYGRSWHLVAFDHKRQDAIGFKVDRVQEAKLLDSAYTIPSTFDIDDYLGDSWGVMSGAAKDPEDVVLIFEQEAGQWVIEENWHKSQDYQELPDGRIQVEFYVGVTPEMVHWLLYYGGNVWVERPLWLRGEVKEQHLKALARWENENV